MTNVESDMTPKFSMKNTTYDRLKLLSLVILPAISTLYLTIGNSFDLPYVQQVVGSVAGLDTLIGVILGMSSKRYTNSPSSVDGSISITTNEAGTKLYSLELNGAPENIDTKKTVTFKVNS